MKKNLPNWYNAIWILLLTLFIAFNLVYHLGAQGLKFARGGRASFQRQYDYQLYKINEDTAFYTNSSSQTVTAVNYIRADVPFCYLCGYYTSNGRAKDQETFTVSNGVPLTRDDVEKKYPELSTMNESCLTFNAAFLLLFGIWILVFPVAWFQRK